ncbi:TonB-dependent receptor [Sphingomonas colocasiae]|uniref:TonB-dependent receptor n=1 Tax=Sphingomonas colocasiae TaxID=1848973 RepID=A0ABS7PPU8_9SPHN|nr:TonB-dependent receptor [Sphingomonas colocasiae]MBY8823248.1 TonB-dependent receptor [Sphingomonas colocasiae]
MRCAAAGALGIAMVTAGTSVHAQAGEIAFSLTARPLADALLQVSRQANVDVTAPEALTRGRTAPAVDGRMTARDALERLLAGSGLRLRQNGETSFLVESARGNGAAPGDGGAAARSGRGTIAGSLNEETTGAALKGARVEIQETGDVVATDELGQFRFANVPAGRVTLSVSYLGYPTTTMSVEVSARETANAPITLVAAGRNPEIIVMGQVSARAQALNQERTAENSSTIISGDLLGNFNGTTISDSMRRAPGIAFQQSNDTGDGTNVIVRGLSPDYNQIKLNGIALPEGSGIGRSANLNNILSSAVSEIRINKTLLANHESAGTGGLIEIETKSPLDRPRRYFNLSADGTKLGKGFGYEYLVSGTASARFGASGNFGISASVQFRKQDLTTYSYNAQGTPGAYLPLAPNGQPATLADLDPRTPFPFYDGAEYLIVGSQTNRNHVAAETLNVSLSAEWAVSSSTTLQVDYVGSRREQNALNMNYNIRAGFGQYGSLRAVPAENGALRYVYGDASNVVRVSNFVQYTPNSKDETDNLSFRGKSALGPLTLNYSAGFAEGRSATPFSANFTLLNDVTPSSVLAPEAINPDTGTVTSYFGPRVGRGVPIPLLTAAGFETLRTLPLSRFAGVYASENLRGKSNNWTGDVSAKYEFGPGILKYVEAGIQYRRSNFRNFSSNSLTYNPIYGPPPAYYQAPLPEIGLIYANLPFSAVAGDTVYRFLTEESVRTFLNNLDNLVTGGHATFLKTPRDPIMDQQYTIEENIAAYIQARADIGKVEVIGGLRIDRNKVDAAFLNSISVADASWLTDQAFSNANRKLVTASDVLTSYLPRVLANYRPAENLIVRAGYFSTVARPQIQQLNRSRNVSFFAARVFGPGGNQPGLMVQEGNPALKPAMTHNFDIGAEWYDGQVGALKVNVFYKRIKNLLEANILTGLSSLGEGFVLPDHPLLNPLPADTYVSYTIPINNPKLAKVWGVEVSAEKRLSFLPGFLSGFGIYTNYTFSKSQKSTTLNWSSAPVYGANGALLRRENIAYQRILPFDNSPRHSGTAGLTYTRPGFDASLYYSAQSRRQGPSGERGFLLDTYYEAATSLDFRAVYNFKLAGADLRFNVEGRNLLRGTADAVNEETVGGVGETPKYYINGYYFGGRKVTLGLSANF